MFLRQCSHGQYHWQKEKKVPHELPVRNTAVELKLHFEALGVHGNLLGENEREDVNRKVCSVLFSRKDHSKRYINIHTSVLAEALVTEHYKALRKIVKMSYSYKVVMLSPTTSVKLDLTFFPIPVSTCW